MGYWSGEVPRSASWRLLGQRDRRLRLPRWAWSEGYVALASVRPNKKSPELESFTLFDKNLGIWKVSESILDGYHDLVLALRTRNAWVAFLLEDLKGGWFADKNLKRITLYGIATPTPVPLPAAAPLLAAALAGAGLVGWHKRRSRTQHSSV